MLIFAKKQADVSKIKKILVLKGIFFVKLQIRLYLRTKFQVYSIILTSFRQPHLHPPTSKWTLKRSSQIRFNVQQNWFILRLVAHCLLFWQVQHISFVSNEDESETVLFGCFVPFFKNFDFNRVWFISFSISSRYIPGELIGTICVIPVLTFEKVK